MVLRRAAGRTTAPRRRGGCGCCPGRSRTSWCASCSASLPRRAPSAWPAELAAVAAPARLRRRGARPAGALPGARASSRWISSGRARGPARRPGRRWLPSSPTISTTSTGRERSTTPGWCAARPRLLSAAGHARRGRRRSARSSSSTSTRTPIRRRSRCCRRWPATGAQLVVVGDPDQSIYALPGCGCERHPRVPERFRGPRAPAAAVLALGRCRRSGRGAGGRVALGGAATAAAGAARRGGRRAPSSCRRWGRSPRGIPAVAIRLFASPAQEAVAVADALRRAHLIDGMPWSSMAVLVRSTRLAGPLQRALADAGVPVETPADERPLVREPALEPLLTLLKAGVGQCPLDEETAVALLCSPLGGADALDVRRLRRSLHAAERAAGGFRRSGELLAECLPSAGGVSCSAEVGRRSAVTARCRGAASASPRCWRWYAPASTGRAAGAGAVGRVVGQPVAPATGAVGSSRPGGGAPALQRHADRQLDAVVALFEAAARFSDRLPAAGSRGLSRRPGRTGDPGRSAGPAQLLRRSGAVAHRPPVEGAGVGPGRAWRACRRASGPICAGAARCSKATRSRRPTTSRRLFAARRRRSAARAAALVDERRLFYVAVTRARRRLMVTAVSGGDEAELRPSRFLGELGVELPPRSRRRPGCCRCPRSSRNCGASLAMSSVAPALREAAAGELARLIRKSRRRIRTAGGGSPNGPSGICPCCRRMLP